MASKDRSRYFCIDVDEAFEASGEKIINSILRRYPTVNYIMVRGQLGWNKKEVNGGYVPTDEFRWKHVWIQRSHNALDKDCVIKNLLKDLPGVEVTKRSLDDTSIANKYTQFVRSWGTFNRSAVHKAPEPDNMNKRVREMTDSEKNDTILQQNQEIERLRKEAADSKSVSNVNSNNTVSNINSNNTTTNNIVVKVVNPYGFESTGHISKEEWKNLVAEGVKEGLAHLACQTIEKIHSTEENKNFYMTHANDENIKVRRHGNVYEDVLLERFARDAPYHYAELVREASTEDSSDIDKIKKIWADNRNRKISTQKVMRKVQKTAMDTLPMIEG